MNIYQQIGIKWRFSGKWQKKKAFYEEDQKAFGERRVGRDREFYVIFAVLLKY